MRTESEGPRRLKVLEDCSWEAIARAWADNGPSAGALGQAIAESPWPALFWECAPVSRATRDTPFECVLAEAPQLAALPPDRSPFRGRLQAPINTFWNLGRDALLVAPGAHGPFGHLATFCRSAAPHLQAAFWQAVGQSVLDWWARTPEPLWLNTSGLGVTWLHVRLDQRPKYYTYTPYRTRDAGRPTVRSR